MAVLLGLLIGTVAVAVDAGPAAAASGDTYYGVLGSRLITFDDATIGAATVVGPLTGLRPGDRSGGLDVRPATNELYLLGVQAASNQLYVVDQATGAATAVGAPFGPGLGSAGVGFDFDPSTGAARVTSTKGTNLSVDPTTGVATIRGALRYARTDAGAGSAPLVAGAAQTHNDAGSTLYGIDTRRDVLVVEGPPQSGTLTTVGALGIDANNETRFDITGNPNRGIAAVRPAGRSGTTLYAVDLSNGATAAIGAVVVDGRPAALAGLAVAPPTARRVGVLAYCAASGSSHHGAQGTADALAGDARFSTVTVVDGDAAQPSGADLAQAYDVVLAATDGECMAFAQSGQALADFAASGGAVVLTTFGFAGSPESSDGSIGFGDAIFAAGLSPFSRVTPENGAMGGELDASSVSLTAPCAGFFAGVVGPVPLVYSSYVELATNATLCASATTGEELIAVNQTGNICGFNSFPFDLSLTSVDSYRALLRNLLAECG